MSWWREADQYGVFFNRDELKTRQRAEPPFVWSEGFLAPQDPKSTGTWMAVNRFGLILALLNRWHEGSHGHRSRGKLIPELALFKNTTEAATEFARKDLSDYSPFTLITMDDTTILRRDWNGSELLPEPAIAPITSSSFQFDEVRKRRLELYTRTVGECMDPKRLRRYHEEDRAGAYSIRMLRDDAQTWSRSKVEVSPTEISWDYFEEFADHELPPAAFTSRLDRSS